MNNRAFSKILILVILIILAGGGLFAWQYWWPPREKLKQQEVKIPEDENILKGIAYNLMNDYLNQFKSSSINPKQQLKSYSVNKVDIDIIEDQCFGFTVDFSVETLGDSNWKAGNGKIVGNWVNNKTEFADVIIEGGGYKIKEMGTGRASASCMDSQITKDETAEWQTYKDEEYGFEIKYLKDLTPEVKTNIPADNIFSLYFGDGKIFRMGIYDTSMEGQIRLYTTEGTEEKILIDNIEGIQFHKADMKGEVAYIPQTLVKNGGKLYLFIGEGETFNQMLSTFRFFGINGEVANLNSCRTKYLDKIAETDSFLLYDIKEFNSYRVFKCDLHTNKESELELLGYSDDINVVLNLSPNGKYITKTSYSSPSVLPKIELMSFDNINKLTILAEGEKDSFMKMIWSDDSSKIAYWTVNRGSAPYPSFKIYYLADITGAEPKLMKTYNDMTTQGFINLKKLASSENKLSLERTKIMDGAPPVWEQDIIGL